MLVWTTDAVVPSVRKNCSFIVFFHLYSDNSQSLKNEMVSERTLEQVGRFLLTDLTVGHYVFPLSVTRKKGKFYRLFDGLFDSVCSGSK